MVCVTVQKNCERLIREGARYAAGGPLRVVHVVKNGAAVLGGDSDGDSLEYLFRISREYGAEMDMLRADDVIATIVDFAARNGIVNLVIGATPAKSQVDVAATLRARLPGVRIFVIPNAG